VKLWLLLLLLPSIVSAETFPFILKKNYSAPAFRADNVTPITQEEIAGYKVWHVPCVIPPVITGEADTFINNVNSYWFISDISEQCLVFVTVDTDGRESVYSPVFRAIDFRAPKAASCTL